MAHRIHASVPDGASTADSGPVETAQATRAARVPPTARERFTSLTARVAAHRVASVAIVFVLVLLPCAVLIGLREQRSQPIFAVDEFAYADYLAKVDDGQFLIHRGELTGQGTLGELACRGYTPDIWPKDQRPACGLRSYDARTFPNSGVNSADIHPPTYFVITDVGARVIMATGVTDNLIRAGRLFGAVWMAAGLTALIFLGRVAGATRPAAAIAAALIGGGISLQWQWQYLTPDAANILIGSLAAIAVLRWEQRGRGLVWIALMGAVAVGVKIPNLMVVFALGGYLLLRAVLARRADQAESEGDGLEPVGRSPRDYLVALVALFGATALTAVGWVAVRAAIAIPGAGSDIEARYAVDHLSVANLTDNIGRFLAAWDYPTYKTYPLSLVISYLLIGALVAAMARHTWRHRAHTLALTTGTVALFGPLFLVAMTYVLTHTYVPTEIRYGTTLVPLETGILATIPRGRLAVVALGAFAVVYHAAGLYTLFHPLP